MNKLFLLALGYIAGSTVSSLYSEKKGKDLKKDLKKACTENDSCAKSILLENFIETHRNFFKELKAKFEHEDTKIMFNEKKQEVIDLIEKYKNDSDGLIEEISGKGKKYLKLAEEKLKEFYQEKKVEGEEFLNSIGKEDDIVDFKTRLTQVYEDLKEKLSKKV